ncbi:Ribosomal protein L11 [Nucleospora cyclopteri]
MVKLVEKDPNFEYLTVRVTGAEPPGPTFSQKVGPLKIAGKVVGEDIKKLTAKDYKLQKVHVELAVQNRQVTLKLVPTTAQLIIRELKEVRQPRKKGAEKVDQLHDGAISFTSVLKVVGEIHENISRSNNMKGTLKQVLGTCLSVGCTVEGHNPKDVTIAVKEGKNAVAELLGVDSSSLPDFLN